MNIEILTLSFDGFKDVWELHYKEFFKHWPDCPYKINLITNNQEYKDSRVKSLKVGDDTDWSTSLINALNKIDAEYILTFYDDFIFYKPVDTDLVKFWVSKAFLLKVDYLRLRPRPAPDHDLGDGYGRLSSNAKYRVSLCCAIIKKAVLMDLLRKGESPWQFELYGTYRSRNLENFYSTNFHLFTYHNALEKGKWNKSVLGLLPDYNIDINKRGVFESKNIPLIKIIKGFIFSKILPVQIQNLIIKFRTK